VDGIFAAIENSPLSVWIRETPSIFADPTIITLHVGSGADIAPRIKLIGGISLAM
jgi:hypothetical protein